MSILYKSLVLFLCIGSSFQHPMPQNRNKDDTPPEPVVKTLKEVFASNTGFNPIVSRATSIWYGAAIKNCKLKKEECGRSSAPECKLLGNCKEPPTGGKQCIKNCGKAKWVDGKVDKRSDGAKEICDFYPEYCS